MFAYIGQKRVEIPKIGENEFPQIKGNCVLVWNKLTELVSVFIKEGNAWKKVISSSEPYFFDKEVCDNPDLFMAFKTEKGLKNLLNLTTGKIIFEEEFKTEQLLDRVSIKNDANQTIFILERQKDDQFVMIDADGNDLLDESIMEGIKWIRIYKKDMGGMTFISFAKKSDTRGMGFYVLLNHKIRLAVYSKDKLINMSYSAITDIYGRIHYPVFFTEGSDGRFFDINGIKVFAN